MKQPTAVCILGMHRCGTSLAARIVNLMGASLGSPRGMMPPGPDNPAGFWERMDIMEIHDSMLESLGRTWSLEEPMPENWTGLVPGKLKDELSGLVDRQFDGSPFWAFKDPRACLLAPLWFSILDNKEVDVKAVLSVRNPFSSARSLEKRQGFSLDKGMALWRLHYESAIEALKGYPVIAVNYDRIIDHSEKEFFRIADFLGVRLTDAMLENLKNAVRPELRRSFPEQGGSRRPDAPKKLKSLFKRLEAACLKPEGGI